MIPLAKPDLSGKESEYIAQVLSSGRLAMGLFTEKFEAAFCNYLCTKYAIACSSGTMGLYICLEVVKQQHIKEMPPRDWSGIRVGMSKETFGASMNAVAMADGMPLVYDDEMSKGHDHSDGWVDRYNLEGNCVYMPCHIFGLSAPEFVDGKVEYKWDMIEDACEALGAKYDGKYLGTFGKAGVFGFYPNKQITTGEGGMIVTNDNEFADICYQIVNQGRKQREPHTIIGTNSRITELQAAIGVAQMERIDEILEKRRMVAETYIGSLDVALLASKGIEVPMHRDSWFAFPLTLSYPCQDQKETLQGLQSFLSVQDIQSSIYFPRHESFPDFIWERRLCLPFYTQMIESEINEVVDSVNKWARR